jgi:hypothetical protein
MTGVGGFLQEFIYGYSGLRWDGATIHLDPSLTRQISGVVLRNLIWRGRRFTISVGSRRTTLSPGQRRAGRPGAHGDAALGPAVAGAPGPNIPTPPGPVTTLRASSYRLQVSADGHDWRTVANCPTGGTARSASSISGPSAGASSAWRSRPLRRRRAPMLHELTLTG